MSTLYLDNFRGFKDTMISLKDVNFLVGENSTGKSSVLALLHLLNSPQFWFSQNFNPPDHPFGGFTDILSATATDKSYFTIGYSQIVRKPGTNSGDNHCYMISYAEADALPAVSFFASYESRRLTAIRIDRGKYRYRCKDFRSETAGIDGHSLFALLSQERLRGLEEFEEPSKPLPTRADTVPIMMLAAMIGRRHLDEETESAFVFPYPMLSHDFVYLAPIRTRPRRTYDGYGSAFSPEGEHTPYLLRKRLGSPSKKAHAFREALEGFGRESGLFHTVLVKRLGTGAGSPFELQVELAAQCCLGVNSVGYGVSQALPVVVEMIARDEGACFAIQQPEVHLHPRAQAALGDLIFQIAENQSKKFLIETHSDFTIDRFRMNYKRNAEAKTVAQILFFQRSATGNQVSAIPVLKNGEYPEDQPQAFRHFFVEEQLDLLGL